MKITIDFEDGYKREYTLSPKLAEQVNERGAGIQIKTCHPFFMEWMEFELVPVLEIKK